MDLHTLLLFQLRDLPELGDKLIPLVARIGIAARVCPSLWNRAHSHVCGGGGGDDEAAPGWNDSPRSESESHCSGHATLTSRMLPGTEHTTH